MSRFDKVAKEWDSSQTRQDLAFNIAETLLEMVPLRKEMHLLDFGAGTGLLTRHLCPYVSEVTALDFSKEMLAQLQKSAPSWPDCRVTTQHSDILKYSTEQRFDGIVSSMSMHHVEDLDGLFKKFSTLLKTDGFIAIADLELEDGSFHDHGDEGVFHFGFEHQRLIEIAERHGFEDIRFQPAHTVLKENNKAYDVFMMAATRK